MLNTSISFCKTISIFGLIHYFHHKIFIIVVDVEMDLKDTRKGHTYIMPLFKMLKGVPKNSYLYRSDHKLFPTFFLGNFDMDYLML